MNTDSCDMIRIPLDQRETLYGDQCKPGMFLWNDSVREVDGVEYRCKTLWAIYPDGSIGALPVRPVPPELSHVNGGNSWEWDGNEDRPTLSPSVHHIGRWHGYVRNGRMESC